MAQLSDDCFAFGGELLRVDDAVRLIADRVFPVAGTELVPLARADGRVLAADAVAPLDLPPFDNSAVDGYAVRHADLAGDGSTTLPVRGRVAAGAVPAPADPSGPAAIRVFTGAPMPAGFDTVFMQEDVRLDEAGRAVLPAGLKAGANRRVAGEDLARGAVALPAGRRLAPADVALLAALGGEDATVRRRLRVALFSTGDEIARPGVPLGPAQLHDANRPFLAAVLGRLGCAVTDGGVLPDRAEAVRTALVDAASGHDLVLTSGGVSTGEEDHVKAAVEAAGALSFWRLAIKPGRPVALGVIGGTAFVGLPGNPVAVFVTFAFVARALLARLGGESWRVPAALPVAADFTYRKKEGRREYVRVRLERDEAGRPVARKHPTDGAGLLTSLTRTDGLVELPEDARAVSPGDVVGYLPYELLR